VETQLREKPLWASQTQEIHYHKTKLVQDSNTHIPDAAIVSNTLTRNPTWTPPNQVFYLKGSSTDSFTLGLLPKIDFNYEHSNSTTTTAWELAYIHNFSLKYTL
jgi:hypothetical protein